MRRIIPIMLGNMQEQNGVIENLKTHGWTKIEILYSKESMVSLRTYLEFEACRNKEVVSNGKNF